MTVISVNDGYFPNKLTSKLLERREKERREMCWAEGWVAEGRVRGGRERATPQFQYLFVCNWWPQRELTRIFLHCAPPPPRTQLPDLIISLLWSDRNGVYRLQSDNRTALVPVFPCSMEPFLVQNKHRYKPRLSMRFPIYGNRTTASVLVPS